MLYRHAHSVHSGDLVCCRRSCGGNHLEVEGREWRHSPFGPTRCGRAAHRYQGTGCRRRTHSSRALFFSTQHHGHDALRGVSHARDLETCCAGNDSEHCRPGVRCATRRSGSACGRPAGPVPGRDKGGWLAERTRVRVTGSSRNAHRHCERVRWRGQKVAGQLARHFPGASSLGRPAASGTNIAAAQVAAAGYTQHAVHFHSLADSRPVYAGVPRGPALALNPPRDFEVKSGG